MALARYVEKRFGMKTRSVPNPLGAVDVGTTVTEIMHGNPDRLSIIVVNLGANDVYVAFDREVSPTRGILLVHTGGSLSLTADEDMELVGYPIYGVTATGTSRVFVLETEAE